jgi:hypothetical protein
MGNLTEPRKHKERSQYLDTHRQKMLRTWMVRSNMHMNCPVSEIDTTNADIFLDLMLQP